MPLQPSFPARIQSPIGDVDTGRIATPSRLPTIAERTKIDLKRTYTNYEKLRAILLGVSAAAHTDVRGSEFRGGCKNQEGTAERR